jgi:hypothetical protein
VVPVTTRSSFERGRVVRHGLPERISLGELERRLYVA